MHGRIVVYLNSTTDTDRVTGVDQDYDNEQVKTMVDHVMQAEGQGTFVLECDNGWVIIPTRSILCVHLERDDPDVHPTYAEAMARVDA